MIGEKEFDAYNKAVKSFSDGLADRAKSEIVAWCNMNPSAGVAEVREQAKAIMSGYTQIAGEGAASLAAEWYDRQALSAGKGLPPAVTSTVYSMKGVDRAVRYQAGKLADGDIDGFAESCADLVRDAALRSLNRTIIENCGRDKKAGVRFARVTTGSENCPFCIMLAGRGAVYHSRQTAGIMDRYHRRCDCKVVPGYEDDPFAVLVEGHDPRHEQRVYERIINSRAEAVRVYESSRDELRDEVKHLDKLLKDAWKEFINNDDDESYERCYGSLNAGLTPDNPISIERGTNLQAKELQEAIWLSRAGYKVALRNPELHKLADGNTSDALLDGATCDFKKVESSKVKKMSKRVTEKLDRQGPVFLVDLSLSGMRTTEAEARAARLVDDPRIDAICLIAEGKLRVIKK